MTDPDSDVVGADSADLDTALVDRLQLIEEQPLEARAEALAQLHDELRAILESGDLHSGA